MRLWQDDIMDIERAVREQQRRLAAMKEYTAIHSSQESTVIHPPSMGIGTRLAQLEQLKLADFDWNRAFDMDYFVEFDRKWSAIEAA